VIKNGEQEGKEMFCQEKSAFLKVNKEEQARAKQYCEEYKVFLDRAKTEREAAAYALLHD